MKRLAILAVLIATYSLVGCGAKPDSDATKAAASGATPASGSKYDSGPRAGEQSIDDDLAKTGEQLFKDKGCSACHAFGTKLSGPDLAGVSMRRTAQWMENQILHPDVMAKEDPISRELMGIHALQMPNQGLTPAEAKSVIEFLKHRDHEASEKATSADDDEKKGD
jgi:mono/diheme cytochrome c family protein